MKNKYTKLQKGEREQAEQKKKKYEKNFTVFLFRNRRSFVYVNS